MDCKVSTTQWTLVLRAQGQDPVGQAALSDLCMIYYKPIIVFLRHDGRCDDQAREIAHDFFERLLSGGLGSPHPERGRFRNYLLGALKHFLANQRAFACASKRGGTAEHVSFTEDHSTEPGYPMPGYNDDTLHFDREWALTLIGNALATLERECADRILLFQTLKPFLDGGTDRPQREAASTLGMSETAVKVAIHRLRVRFRTLIREAISATINHPDELSDELDYLIKVASIES